MKKLLAVLSVATLLSPALAFAGASDVSMDTTVVISVGGIEVDISGSTATVETVTVNDSSFSFGLQSGSSVQITAPNLNTLTPDIAPVDQTVNTCDASASILKFVGTAARTITITPGTALCGGGTSSAASSGGQQMGGGGNRTTTPAVPATTPAVPASGLSSAQVTAIVNVLTSFGADSATIAKVQAALSGTGGTTTTTTGSVTSTAVSVFKSDLATGSLGSEVKALQQFLNAHGYTVSSTGAGSVGNETSTFGGATRAALIKYQKAKGITPAVGYFGAKTRAAINAE
jgi:hypothetical protein